MPHPTKPLHAITEIVVDASAIVDLLLGNELGGAVGRRLAGHALHAQAHLDAEVLSALGRLHRAGDIKAQDVESTLQGLAAAPIQRHGVSDLLVDSWVSRQQLRLVDALYIQLAVSLGLRLITADGRLQDVPAADVVVA